MSTTNVDQEVFAREADAAFARLTDEEKAAVVLADDLAFRAEVSIEALVEAALRDLERRAVLADRMAAERAREEARAYWAMSPEEQHKVLRAAMDRACQDVRTPAKPGLDLPPGAGRLTARALKRLMGKG
jgi:hypothetical protein